METTHFHQFKEIPMPKLDALCIEASNLGEDFHKILQNCPQLKRLEIDNCVGELNWMNGDYPTLAFLRFIPAKCKSIEEISMFLELNANIRHFATSAEFLWKNRANFMSCNIELDELTINAYGFVEFESFWNFLNELYERGFCKKLEFYLRSIWHGNEMEHLATVTGLVKLYTVEAFTLSSFETLEEIF